MARNTITQRIQLEGGAQVTAQLNRIGEAGQKAFAKLGDAQTRVAPAARQLAGDLQQVEIRIRGVATESEKAQKAVIGLKTRFALVGAAALTAGYAIARFAKNAIDSADALGKQAQALGLSAGELNRYQKAAAIAGVESGAFVNGLQKITGDLAAAVTEADRNLNGFIEVTPGRFQRGADVISANTLKIGEAFTFMQKGVQRSIIVTAENIDQLRNLQSVTKGAQKDIESSASAYVRWGISLLDANGQARTLAEVLDDIGGAIKGTDDKLKKVRIAEDFGLRELLPLLDDSKQGFGELLEIVKRFSVDDALQNKLSDDARDFSKKITIIQQQLDFGKKSLTVGFGQLFQAPLRSLYQSLQQGTGDASQAVQKSLLFLTTVFGGLQGRFNAQLQAAFKDPLNDLLGFLTENGDQIDETLKAMAKGIASFATDVVRVFAFRFDNGQFQFIRESDAEVQNKWLITLRESALAIGEAIAGAYKNYIKPAFTGIQNLARRAVAAINEIFGTNVNVGEIAVVAILLKITGLLSPVISLAAGAAAALGAVLAPALLLGAALTDDFEGAIKDTIAFVKELFKTGRDEAGTMVQQIKGFFQEIGLLSKNSQADAAQPGADNPYSRPVPLPEKKDLDEQEQSANSIADAWGRVRSEVNGFFTNLRTLVDTIAPIADYLRRSFNWLFGTEFTPAQAVVLLVLAQMTGVLRTVAILGSAAAIIFSNLLGGILRLLQILPALGPAVGAVLGAFGKLGTVIGRTLLLVAGTGAKGLLGAFRLLGTYVAGTFATKSAAGLARLLPMLLRFAGLPGLIISGLAGIYFYWDEIRAGGSAVISWLRTQWGAIWNDTEPAKNGIRSIAKEHEKYFRRVPQTQKNYWLELVKIMNTAFGQVGDIIAEQLTPKAETAQKWRAWFEAFKVMATGAFETAKKALFGPSEEQQQQGFWDRVGKQADEAWKQVEKGWEEFKKSFGEIDTGSLGGIGKSLQKPLKDIEEGFRRLFKGEIPLLSQSAEESIVSDMGGAESSVAAAVGRIVEQVRRAISEINRLKGAAASASNGYATGGFVSGPGTGTSDSIPAWLSNGEFVLRASAVRKYGLDFLYALNGLKMDPKKMGNGWPGFNMGGLVNLANRSVVSNRSQPALVQPSLPGKTFDLVIGDQRFSNLLAPQDVAGELMRHATQAKMRAGGKKPRWY